jgi:photoactive yellow protein
VAAALQARALAGEIVGRVAGDVFGVYIGDATVPRAVRERALAFSDAFSHSFSTGDREGREFVALTASLGVAIAPQDGETIDEVLSHADAALVAAKERGPGTLMMFSAGMEGDLRRRAALRAELTAAIANDEFELYFQPHINLRSGEVGGCEALIRWHHPTRGLLLPADFIPFAEQNGLITGIDDWVMRSAFAAANDFSALWPNFRLFFNLCGRQAGDPAVVRAFVAAARAGTRIESLGVEITETDAMRDVAATRRVCRALHRLGVSVALDDFGVGYSSLASLENLPVDIVKIDRSFIFGAAHDERKASITATILEISGRFGFETLAEGVEDPDDAAWLRGTPCRLAQGYLFARPLTFAAFKAWLDERGLRRLGTLSAGELQALPFGAIVVDLEGTILSYNQYEAQLSRLDSKRVVGKNFFRDIAPCTAVQNFEGRMRDFAASPELVSTSFRYFFPFAHGDVDVDIRFVKSSGDTVLIVLERIDEAKASALMATTREHVYT